MDVHMPGAFTAKNNMLKVWTIIIIVQKVMSVNDKIQREQKLLPSRRCNKCVVPYGILMQAVPVGTSCPLTESYSPDRLDYPRRIIVTQRDAVIEKHVYFGITHI
jgi:hypothetical protein